VWLVGWLVGWFVGSLAGKKGKLFLAPSLFSSFFLIPAAAATGAAAANQRHSPTTSFARARRFFPHPRTCLRSSRRRPMIAATMT